MKYVVGVAEMKIASHRGDVIVTHALGSCLGISIHDPISKIGGILHIMMPLSRINPERAKANPYLFVDTGVPEFFRKAYAAGAEKRHLTVKVAGGANVQKVQEDSFVVGKRNYAILKKILWKNDILIDAEDVGGSNARTMYLEIGSGRVWLSTAGVAKEL